MSEKRETKMLPSVKGYGRSQTEWIKSDWFCMECGKQDVWQDADAGEDYYVGCEARCFSCRHVMQCLEKLSRIRP